MKSARLSSAVAIIFFVAVIAGTPAHALVRVQCPGDLNGDAVWTGGEVQPPNTACMHFVATDGFINMADQANTTEYIFGFTNVTGTPLSDVLAASSLGAEFSAPTIFAKEGDDYYLTLTTRGMVMRADLFDAHTVHWHGFPDTASIFDGEPMSTIAVNQGASLTYYYKVPAPGTYMYHCHNEATEHMQMGMLGNLYVTPIQDGTTNFGGICPSMTYVYDDGDGSTCYDVGYPIQIVGFDPAFHDANLNIQPLPFSTMTDTYMMLNGRGYPDTINPNQLGDSADNDFHLSQKIPALITATANEKILLRISSLSTVHFSTLTSPSIPMLVVGKDAKLLRSSSGTNLYYETNSVTLGGGQSADVILNTASVPPGTYFLYSSNLDDLSNDAEDYGGMMTEIVIQ